MFSITRKIKHKISVETITAYVIKQLQAKHCYIFGLTARYAELAEMTRKDLLHCD